MSRHPSVEAVYEWFDYTHLPTGPARTVSQHCGVLAATVLAEITADDPELSTGLRKLLEAKDCFVRAAIRAERDKTSFREPRA